METNICGVGMAHVQGGGCWPHSFFFSFSFHFIFSFPVFILFIFKTIQYIKIFVNLKIIRVFQKIDFIRHKKIHQNKKY